MLAVGYCRHGKALLIVSGQKTRGFFPKNHSLATDVDFPYAFPLVQDNKIEYFILSSNICLITPTFLMLFSACTAGLGHFGSYICSYLCVFPTSFGM
jgi:hypothetical protein